ncbi:hypothetical protein SAMN04487904_103312 [Actinopolyspora lacussalsi subsp. righensis]|uniref:Uncharacterized protein n=1 Tax=Actinopolyspora righensis TaxID=995060 RepID=A0A1I6YWK4_9ACTN|nr:hypothetical protein [Actinopolyspora righensis]SFT54806.1 hypothetical protein SAMN04487904_103312 [Actinopolyspora righensis]
MSPSDQAGRATVELLRTLVATGLLMSAVVHLELWAQGVRDVAVIGPLFLLNAVAGVVLAFVLLWWKHWLPVLGSLGFGVLTLVAFFLAVTIGLFGSEEVAVGVPQLLAGIAEGVVIVAAVPLLLLGSHD